VSTVFQFALLGLGLGGIYTLLGTGLVMIYRGSGVLNFAHGAYAMTGAYIFYELHGVLSADFTEAFLAAIAGTALLGALTHLVIMRRLANASGLVRLIATLGLLATIQGVAELKYGSTVINVTESVPNSPITILGVVVPEDQLILLGIAAAITLALYVLSRRTVFGLAISAVADNSRAAASLGWSPDAVAAVTWSLGAALAAVAGILVVPLIGLDTSSLTLMVIDALAAALLAGFSSFPLLLVGGIVTGILQSEVSRYVTIQGAYESVPFLLIMVVLVVRGKALPVRSHVFDRLPHIGSGNLSLIRTLVLSVILAILIVFAFPAGLVGAVTVQLTFGVIFLSVVVLTGYAGQLSLAQFAMAGLGAFFAGQLVSSAHVPFAIALVIAVVATIACGLIVGLPALRTRGVNLAVVTLGLAVALSALVFNSASLTGGTGGIQVGAANFLGLNIDPISHPQRYAIFTLVWFVLAMVVVSNLRRGRAGRRFIAVRANERAAASLGISVFGVKLAAFGIASALAGLGGVLYGFQYHDIDFTVFSPVATINATAFATIGGVGHASGAIIGAGFENGTVGGWILDQFGNLAGWLNIIGGISVLLVLVTDQDGIAASWSRRRARRRARKGPALAPVTTAPARDQPRSRAGGGDSELLAEGLTVRYGAVVALEDFTIRVRPGEVIGLVGPNGAGKTTAIDAMTGFVRVSGGAIRLGTRSLAGMSPRQRARAGLTRSFQSVELFGDLTIRENLQVSCDRRDALAYVTTLVRPGHDPLSDQAQAAVDMFSLSDCLSKYPGELSNGQRRLAGIARTIAGGPSIVLLDEPAAGLDDNESAELSRLIRALADDWRIGILLIEHDVNLVMSICDRVTVLDFGVTLAEGTPAEIQAHDEVIRAYLGTSSVAESEVS
jgi:ABC-type branched-subunit amino acid transport system ATPase component/ABC-type branched-subunit amino acid transport system permease subunit